MSNPNGGYLIPDPSYVWLSQDVYEISQLDTVEGAATGASFGGRGVENAPHAVLVDKAQWLYNRLLNIPHGQTVYSLASGQPQISGTFTVPAYVSGIWVRGWGMGGNGGNALQNTSTSGGGGGGGGYFEFVATVNPGDPITWLISGSATTFGATTALAGANGGNAGGSSFGGGGAGGTVSPSGPLYFPGSGGEVGRAVNILGGGTLVIGGEGGASWGCGHGHYAWVGGAIAGADGRYPGQGGGGGVINALGGKGGPGMIVVQW
jgi:hypothetical protein